jgi:hypothetical protein
MRTFCMSYCQLSVYVATALLAGCGGSQLPIKSATGAMPQSRAVVPQAALGRSWMLPEAKSKDLLYVSDNGAGKVYVFTYPKGKLVGTLTGFHDPNGQCRDARGDVFITNSGASEVIEYGHGGSSPIATLSDPGELPLGCATDPRTGTLAVTNACTAPSCGGAGDLTIYKNAKGAPKSYTVPGMVYYGYCGYDASGNLFLDGNDSGSAFEFAELPGGSKKFKKISGLESIGYAGGVQWDGKYLAVADGLEHAAAIYQVQISGSKGTIVGTTELNDSLQVLQFWIQGKRVIDPDQSADNVKFYHYPAGGSPTKTITGNFDDPNGAVVSPAK